MLGKNKKMYWVDCLFALALVAFGWLVNYSEARTSYPNERVVRAAELTQAWSYLSGYKSRLEENWTGYFKDVKTGAMFEWPISGGVYQTYKSGKRGLVYDLNLPRYKFEADVDRTGWWAVATMLSFVCFVIAAIAWIFWVVERKKENTPHPDFAPVKKGRWWMAD